MKTSNPVFNKKTIQDFVAQGTKTEIMTVQGTVNKIAIMLLLVIVAASYSWSKVFSAGDTMSGMSNVRTLMMIGGIGGFVTALILTFKKEKAHIFAPIYAVLEGLFLGGISAYFEAMLPGLVMRAVLLTFAVLFGLLFAYKSRIIKVTQKFRAGVFASTAGIAIAYLVSFVLRLFGLDMSFMYGGGTLGLIITLGIVVIAALNLILDFDFIAQGANNGLPKYFEWYGAFGLMVTLIWLYLEILRLLTIFANRD